MTFAILQEKDWSSKVPVSGSTCHVRIGRTGNRKRLLGLQFVDQRTWRGPHHILALRSSSRIFIELGAIRAKHHED
jgi:hypothetical protein